MLILSEKERRYFIMSLKFSNFLREVKENNRELFDLWMAKNKQNPNKDFRLTVCLQEPALRRRLHLNL